MIDVHNDPANAVKHGRQALSPEAFEELAKEISELRKVLNK
jgi:3-deoxy-D-arabino-heptulosonate 7-phosphate (DAHP) synthase